MDQISNVVAISTYILLLIQPLEQKGIYAADRNLRTADNTTYRK